MHVEIIEHAGMRGMNAVDQLRSMPVDGAASVYSTGVSTRMVTVRQ